MTRMVEGPAADLLVSLVLEDGRTIGEAAYKWQLADQSAVLDLNGPRRHFWLRGRGMGKTSDAAAVALALLITEAPPRSQSYAWAVDEDQAKGLARAIGDLVSRSGLETWVAVSPNTVTNKSTQAVLSVASSDGASALGKRPWLQVVDEVAAWPSSADHSALWSAIISGQPKIPNSRLIVTTTAGSPTGIGHRVWEQASSSSHWRASKRPGPSPWWSEADIEALRADSTNDEWRRLILCDWVEGDDVLSTPDDIAACVGNHTAMPWQQRYRYVAALDIGVRKDLSALAVGHTERRDNGRLMIIDRVLTWRPGKNRKVDLDDVQEAARRVCREYHARRLTYDRTEAEQLVAGLGRSGIRTEEYVYSTTSTNKLARRLYIGIRDRTILLPDDPELISELQTVRLVETGPRTIKMINPAGTHDDAATAVGMVIAELSEEPDPMPARFFFPGRSGEKIVRATQDATPRLPAASAARQALREGPGGVPWLLVPGSANDRRRAERHAYERRTLGRNQINQDVRDAIRRHNEGRS